jgi:hypothetical protein
VAVEFFVEERQTVPAVVLGNRDDQAQVFDSIMRRLASASPRSIRFARLTSWAAVSSLCRLMAARKRASESAGSGTIAWDGSGSSG